MDLMGKTTSITSSMMSMGKKGANMGRNALVSVANNIPTPQLNIAPTGFMPSSASSTIPSRSSSGGGFDILGGLMGGGSSRGYGTSSSHDHSTRGHDSYMKNKSLHTILTELGLYDDDQELERLAIFYKFNKSCDMPPSPKGYEDKPSEDDDEEESKDVQVEARIMPIERFVMDLLKRGYEPQWCDAAFRAFSIGGMMNKYDYAIAIKSLETTERHMNNPTWLDIRRYLVFNYYDRDLQKKWNQENFYDFLNDISLSKDQRPERFGVVNQVMINIPETISRGEINPEDDVDMIHAYAISKVELAVKKSEYEELTYSYLRLEKQLCAMKLRLAGMMEVMEASGVKWQPEDE